MEKRKPHYDLREVKKMVADPMCQSFTYTAIQDGAKLNLTPEDMQEIVLALSPSHFYKSYDHVW